MDQPALFVMTIATTIDLKQIRGKKRASKRWSSHDE